MAMAERGARWSFAPNWRMLAEAAPNWCTFGSNSADFDRLRPNFGDIRRGGTRRIVGGRRSTRHGLNTLMRYKPWPEHNETCSGSGPEFRSARLLLARAAGPATEHLKVTRRRPPRHAAEQTPRTYSKMYRNKNSGEHCSSGCRASAFTVGQDLVSIGQIRPNLNQC